jgi:hypothetical protein
MATTPTTLADRLAALEAAVVRLAGAARATSDPDDVVTGDWVGAAPGIDIIPYRRGSRPYPPVEHLEVTRDHVARHAAKLERAGPPRANGRVIIGR